MSQVQQGLQNWTGGALNIKVQLFWEGHIITHLIWRLLSKCQIKRLAHINFPLWYVESSLNIIVNYIQKTTRKQKNSFPSLIFKSFYKKILFYKTNLALQKPHIEINLLQEFFKSYDGILIRILEEIPAGETMWIHFQFFWNSHVGFSKKNFTTKKLKFVHSILFYLSYFWSF